MTHRNLLTKSEITSFGSDIVIAFYNECPPIICRRLNYLVNKQFKGKFDDNPLHNSVSIVDTSSNIGSSENVVENVSIDPPVEEKVVDINNFKKFSNNDCDEPWIDKDSSDVLIEQFYFN